MIKIKRRNTFNFYESFSDLIFCTLVLFLFLILFLAINVNHKVEDIKEAEKAVQIRKQEINEVRKGLEKEELEIAARKKKLEADINKIKNDIAKEKADLELKRQNLRDESSLLGNQKENIRKRQNELDSLLGTYRFTGRKGNSYLNIAVDVRKSKPVIYLVPDWLVDDITTVHDLSLDEKKEFSIKRMDYWYDFLETTEGITLEQLEAIFKNTSFAIRPKSNNASFLEENVILSEGQLTQILLILKVMKLWNDGYGVIAVDGKSLEHIEKFENVYRFGDTAVIETERKGKKEKIKIKFEPVSISLLDFGYVSTLDRIASGVYSKSGNTQLSKEREAIIVKRIDTFYNTISDMEFKMPKNIINNHSYGLPALRFSSTSNPKQIMIGNEIFTITQFNNILKSIGGAGVVIEYVPTTNEDQMPPWITKEILIPNGFVNKSPNLPFVSESGL